MTLLLGSQQGLQAPEYVILPDIRVETGTLIFELIKPRVICLAVTEVQASIQNK